MTQLDYYLTLPWTVRSAIRDDDGEYLTLTIDELPGFVVAGEVGEDITDEFWDALEGYLQTFIDDGQAIPTAGTSEGGTALHQTVP